MDIREGFYSPIIKGFKFIDRKGTTGWLYYDDGVFVFTQPLDSSSIVIDSFTYFTDGSTWFRRGVVTGALVTDQYLSGGDLSSFKQGGGTVDVDYIRLESLKNV